MHYKGYGKHTQEELELIIDELQNEKTDLEFTYKKDHAMLNELTQLIKDIYYAAKDFENDKELKAEDIARNISKNIEMFSRQYGFKL